MGRSAANLWCPNCKEVQPCHSINPSTYGEHEKSNQWMTDSGVNFFRRLRQCDACGKDFPTVEIEEAAFRQMDQATTTLKAVRKAVRRG